MALPLRLDAHGGDARRSPLAEPQNAPHGVGSERGAPLPDRRNRMGRRAAA